MRRRDDPVLDLEARLVAAEQLAQQRAAEIQTKKNAINSLNNKIGELETQLRAAKERNSILSRHSSRRQAPRSSRSTAAAPSGLARRTSCAR